ncbi:NAD(P)/FAD-dependent oxidoreductase [Rhodococcus sp. BP-252]|uniref:FAD/NAD(P)-binding domain-containing protein n=1 Tax=Rhodococcoides kyotonense TaxID=398843 RepID=A0A177YME6_9NOCA|nr:MULTISPECIES: NAD(P)/FAD-dependent oxidoreductase [Rhodococcus]MBY6412590.1 NAD(P)/FAD-dependent oxidoreductase [Rhodococcus sp. BP-320]MBY6417155.1 NAD(P)/FAD-dependent oxidoreductase [Rhodococcus sp. BP-321]MBY6423243.1 NAD(P)/FAD-dependent oxidoreductase [Rhodococcus sp. BP-324]MBY6427179.1 NAD(P)/FAD-dependent oxidoreductase [Rhodococcus sp. BP-323]MBY6432208.1 NAD(P)/FAD-dependent oxidoreductase [Rhodococcus sp. BP-322]
MNESHDDDFESVATEWIQEFGAALATRDADAAAALFRPDGWWRDLLMFGWDLRSLNGNVGIGQYLAQAHDQGDVRLSLVGGATIVGQGDDAWIQAVIAVDSDSARGRGVLRLTRSTDDRAWKAWTLLTAMDELVGHEESTGARRPRGGAQGANRIARNWQQHRAARREFAEGDPEVLVVGGGHGGLGLAARLGQLDVATLVIDRNERIGDNWRNRYHSLVLHDPVWYDHLPYLPFPSTWPVYTPKDKIGDWLEFYASTMELNVWTGSELVASTYDDDAAAWTVTVRRSDGTERTLRPRHLVLATGVSGTEPNMPTVADSELFAGSISHSSSFASSGDLQGKNAIVVGSCNSGHDIAQELFERGAEVTMLQRSPSYVVSVDASKIAMAGLYDETGPPTETADLLGASFPFKAVPDIHRNTTAAMAELDEELLDGLRRAGFLLSSGIDGTGALMLFLQKGGGYYINVGCSELIAAGDIGIRSGVEIERFTEHGVHLTDGTSLSADIVVFATGFKGMLQTARRLLGEDVAHRCGPVWGLDAEGELQGVWRESGHPGLWFMGGNLAMARYYGKFLALQIKAKVEGLHPSVPRSPVPA